MLDDSTYPPLTYAFVEKINRTVYVIFEGDSKTKRKSLCVGDGTSAGPPTTSRETQPTSSKSTKAPAKDGTSAGPPITPRETQPTYSESTSTLAKSTKGSSTGIVVGVVIAVTILVAAVLAVIVRRRYMTRACFNRTATAKTTGQPSTGVSTDVDNQQQVEYVNTANNEMHIKTGNNMESNTYEKLNTTKGVDNYLSLQEIIAVEHDYQNT